MPLGSNYYRINPVIKLRWGLELTVTMYFLPRPNDGAFFLTG